ncbi:MAG: sigma-54-dependent Fis family transcriptional regulator [Calditrichaeota bacterium]|nr:MAG: sigma-54-dependent Fis family transcriptional regulator [Calditrichota bacterium]
MNPLFRKIANYKRLALIYFNEKFKITDQNEQARKLLMEISPDSKGDNLIDYFPELFGNETEIQTVCQSPEKDFQLTNLNRSDRDGKLRYINLMIISGENEAFGLMVLEDVTREAELIREINQQKYELLLYEKSPLFRKQFLADSILGNSPPIQAVKAMVEKLMKVPNATVLLLGESGTGKNHVARVIHYSSMPADAPFVDINCAALPETLIEAELFGYEKGAFTHATTSKAGLLEEAEGGTIFLDEIGELPLNLQAKLLSVLETKTFRRLGSNKPISVNVRIIAATNRNLAEEIRKGTFREDLYFRLNVVSIKMPPLRELGEDILIISEHFLKIFNVEFKKHVKGFTPEAQQMLLRYPWPGNVRELCNTLERVMIFIEKDYIDAEDLLLGQGLPMSEKKAFTLPPEGINLEELERQLIESALERTGYNKSKAARLLGLSRDTLRYRIEKFGLS